MQINACTEQIKNSTVWLFNKKIKRTKNANSWVSFTLSFAEIITQSAAIVDSTLRTRSRCAIWCPRVRRQSHKHGTRQRMRWKFTTVIHVPLCEQNAWRHPRNRKYAAYLFVVRAEPFHRRRWYVWKISYSLEKWFFQLRERTSLHTYIHKNWHTDTLVVI